MRKWTIALAVAAFLIVGTRTASAGPIFGWACVTNCARDGGPSQSPAGFMLEVEELDEFDFDQGMFWPTFLWQVVSMEIAYYDDATNVFMADGNPFLGWPSVQGGGYLDDVYPTKRLVFSTTDAAVNALEMQFQDLRIWSDPTIEPNGAANHYIWSVASANNTTVSTGLLISCNDRADCLSPTHHVPEPSTFGAIAVGLAGFIAAARRKRRG